MNLGQCIDPSTWHCLAECAYGALDLLADRQPLEPGAAARAPEFERVDPGYKLKPLKVEAAHVLQFIRRSNGPTAPEIRKASGLQSYQVVNILNRLQIRGDIRITGERRRFRYWSVK